MTSTSKASICRASSLDRPLDPKNAHRYAYAGKDPINNIDLTGRDDVRRTFVSGTVGGTVGPAGTGAAGFVATAPFTAGIGGFAGCAAVIPSRFIGGAILGAGADALVQGFGY